MGQAVTIVTDAADIESRPADRVALAAAAVGVASVIALDPGGWFPFSIAKWPAVLVCALLAGAALAWSGGSRVDRRPVAAWVVLLVAVVVSAVAGLDGRMAWFGTSVRHLGAVTWLVFALLFGVGHHVGAVERSTRVFARGLVVAGGLLGGYTAWEVLVGAPVDYVSDSSRAGGPYGSAAYLGAACCLLLPVAGGVAASRSETRRWRAGAGVVAASLLVAVFASGTRGALLGLVVSAVIVAGAVVFAGRSGSRPRGGFAATQRSAVVVAVGSAVVLLGLVIVVNSARFEREAPIGSRLDEWRLGLSALRERPLFGFGPEGYRIVVDRHLTPDYVRSYGDAVLPDRAHNAILDVALSSGIVAGLAFAALLVMIVAAALRLVRSGTGGEMGLGVAAIAFVVQQQFLFPIAEIDAVFWIVAGAVVAAARVQHRGGESETTATDERAGRHGPGSDVAGPEGIDSALTDADWHGGRRLGSVRVGRVVGVVLVIVAAGVAVVGVRSVAADRLVRSATETADVEQAISDAERAVELDGNDVRLSVVLARSYERRQTLNGVDAAIAEIERAQQISALDPTLRREQARLASLRASITGTADDRGRATSLWAAIVSDAPNCASCQRSFGVALAEGGEVDDAIAALEQAQDLGDDAAAALLATLRDSATPDLD